MTASDPRTPLASLAWAGWQTRVPGDWRPLRIEGGWARGSLIAGNADQPILQIKWWRPDSTRFQPDRWLRRRLRKVKATPARDGPAPPAFSHSAWIPGYGPGTGGGLWYGYAPAASLVIEVVTNSTAPKRDQRTVSSLVLASLTVSPPDAAVRWALYGASFESPPRFCLTARRLNLGDIALQLAARDGSRLMLRQVYPAALALARRELARWLEFPPFDERRRFRPSGLAESWAIDARGHRLEGIRRTGRKTFPFPLGACAPRSSIAAVVHDRELGRLLLVEYDSPRDPDEALPADLLRAMNWALREPGGQA